MNEPTRDQNILDLVLTTNADLINSMEVGEPFSDHNMITFTINVTPYQSCVSKKDIYAFKKADWSHLRSLFQHSPWNCAFTEENIDNNWTAWKDLFFAAVDQCVPKYKQKRKSSAPWITKELIKLCRKKKTLYKRAKKSGSEDSWSTYRQFNNALKTKCNSARWQHLKNLADKLKSDNNSKPFWNYIKSKRKGTNDLVLLKDGESETTGDQNIAQQMNAYFSSVFTKEQRDYLPLLNTVVNDQLCSIQCTVTEVEKYLKALNVHKSPGPDLISTHVLKECAQELAIPLCVLFNKSFTSGLLPVDWKIANITPIHKKGSKHKKENYRQISLTSIISKVAEKIIRSRVLNFWTDHQVLNPNQFGFTKGKSTLAQLLSSFNDWSSSRNNSKTTDCIFLDLAKAFDSVPHERLLLKLQRHGIEGSLFLWFRNFLTNRQQRVVIRGTYSNWAPVISGVPQGTILGPTLFLLYINDITNDTTSTIKLFADDTKIYRELNNVDGDTSAVQSDLDSLSNWTTDWQVQFNPQKCEVMRITHKRDKSKQPYYISNTELTPVDSFKDLGVMVSSDLSWSKHVDYTVNKANKVLGLLKRTIGGKNKEIFSMLYKSLVRPILEYASPVWSPYLVKDILAIEKIQRRASRIALGQKPQEMSYEERCKILKWSTLDQRREFLSLVECFKIVFGLNGLNFNDFFQYTNCKSTRANHQYKIQTKSAKCNCLKYSFFVRIIRPWNNLPNYILDDDTNLSKFKSRLKNHMNIY